MTNILFILFISYYISLRLVSNNLSYEITFFVGEMLHIVINSISPVKVQNSIKFAEKSYWVPSGGNPADIQVSDMELKPASYWFANQHSIIWPKLLFSEIMLVSRNKLFDVQETSEST